MSGEELQRLVAAGCLIAIMTFVLMYSLKTMGDWFDGDDNGEG